MADYFSVSWYGLTLNGDLELFLFGVGSFDLGLLVGLAVHLYDYYFARLTDYFTKF